MGRVNRSFVFWALLVAVVAVLPATLLANKAVYTAKIYNGTKQVGSSSLQVQLVSRKFQYHYAVATFQLPNQIVQAVRLEPADGSWSLLLCETGGDPGDDCTYTADGNLNDMGAIVLGPTVGVSEGAFLTALQAGTLKIKLSDGVADLGEGAYVQVYP